MAVFEDAGEIIRDRLRPNKIKVTWIVFGRQENHEQFSRQFFNGQKNIWYLKTKQCYKADSDESERSLTLSLRNCVIPATGYCTFSILDANRKEVETQKRHFSNFSTGSGIDYDIFADAEKSDKLKVGGRWRIICRIAVVEGYDPSGKLSNTGGLPQDLNNLLTSGKFSDVVLCAGGRKFKAHRYILAARSPVFSLMFSNELEKSKSGRVDLTDLSAEVLEDMLKFIYTGKSVLADQMYHDKDNQGINQDLAIGLLQVADKYQLDKLKVICEDALADSLTAESAHKILTLSSLHRAKGLVYQCIDFINLNRDEFISQFVADGKFSEKTMA